MSAYKRTRSGAGSAKRSRAISSRGRKIANQRKVVSTVYKPLTVKRFPFPLRMQNHLRYCEEFQVVLDGSGFGSYLFRTNGLYDPNYTGTGHQPMYFDKLTAIYNHYHVTASKCKATVVRTGTASSVQMAMYIDDDTVTSCSAISTAFERPGSKTSYSNPSQGVQRSSTCYWNGQYAFGGNVIDNDTLKGTGSSDPTEQQYFVINLEGNGVDTINVFVEIDYTVTWSELKSEPQN